MKNKFNPLPFLYHSFILPLNSSKIPLFSSRSWKLRLALIFLSLTLLGAFVLKLTMFNPTEAAWYNDNWGYRKKITFGNTGSADSDKKVKFDIDTAALITAGKLQSDCGDSRFTDPNGIVLQYYLDAAGGACNTNSTDYYVLVPTISVGTNTLYHYYGNSVAANGTNASQFSQSTFSPNSGPTISSTEENSPAPSLYLKFDESQGTTAANSGNGGTSLNGTLGTGSSAPTWKTEDECFVEGCLDFESNDYVSVSHNVGIGLSNVGTIQAWVRSDDVSSTESNFATWTSITAPDGVADVNWSDVDSTIVGNKIYYAAFLNNNGTGTFHTANSDLDGSNLTAWTSQTAPTGSTSGATSSVAIDSDGVKLYYAALTHNGATETFFTAYSDLNGSNFSSWTNQPDPNGTGAGDPADIAMVIVGSKMYLAAYMHDNLVEAFQIASANLDGTGFVSWTTPSVTVPDGVSSSTGNATSTTIASDGNKLYYAAFFTNTTTEGFYTTSSNLDGSGFSSWTSRTAPDGNGSSSPSFIDMVLVGDTLYYAAYLHNQATEAFSTANMNIDETNFSGWTSRNTGLDGAGFQGSAVPSVNTDGKKLYYTAFSYETTTESLYITSSDITSHPIISKSGAYELIQTGGGFVFDWNGSPKSFGSISGSDWNHVAVVQDGTTMKYYVNGTVVREQSTTTHFASNSNNLYVGSDLTRHFNGRIDEVKVYPYARSEDEIKQDYISRGSVHGVSTQFGANDMDAKLQEGLVGWWKMDENTGTTTADGSGAGNTGTLGTGTSAPTWSGGRFGSGLDFDGNSDYVDPGSTVDDAIEEEYSFSVWIKADTSGGNSGIIGLGSNSTRKLWLFRGSGAVTLSVDTGDGRTSITGSTSESVWEHWAGTYKNNTLVLYKNGQEVNRATNSGTLDIPTVNYIGHISGFGFFNGIIDEIRIYNRALSPAEISVLYNWAPGPVAYYNFDEGSGTSLNDRSGNGINSSSFEGNPLWTTGKYGSALKFDGSDDYINFAGGETKVQLVDTNDFTLEAWFKLDGTGASYHRIVGNGSNTGKGYGIQYSAAANNIIFRIEDTAGDTHEVNSTQTLSLGTWYHVVGVFDDDDTTNTTIYLNGVNVKTSTTGTLSDINGSDQSLFNIGASSNPIQFFNGSIDEVRYYNYARTPSQIIEDMNGGHPVGGSPVGSQVGYWKLDEMSGTTAYDESINANTLTLSTASWTASGKYGGAWNGLGTNWLSQADDADLDFSATDDFSISTWFKTDSTTHSSGSKQFIVNKGSSTTAGYAITAPTNELLCFEIDDDGDWTPDVSACTTTDYYDGTWHHAVAVRNTSTDTISFYIDGVLQASTTDTTTATLANSLSFYVGDRDGTDNGTEFDGDIDEVKIYRAALTTDQIKTEYNQGKSIVLGSLSTGVGGTAPSWSQNRSYCVPGDTSTCNTPVGEWKMDEGSGTSAYDTSGNGNTGTLTGGPTWTQGKKGSAVSFDGVDDSVGMGDNLDMGTSDFTLSAWIKADATQLDSAPRILSKRQATAGADGYEILLSSTGKIRAVLGAAAGSSYVTADSGTSVNDAKWHHITTVYDRDGNMSTYIDGLLNTSLSISAESSFDVQTTQHLRIGVGSEQVDPYFFTGFIDDVRIYDYARTPAQIAWEYNQGAPVAWYKMDECQGTTINDWGPNANGGYNGNHGTISAGNTSGSNDSVGTCSSGASDEMWANGTTGKFHASLDFDDTNDTVTISDDDILDFVDGGDFAFSAWVNIPALSNNNAVVAKKTSTTGTEAGYIMYVNSSGQVGVYIGDGSQVTNIFSPASTITAGTWAHITVVYEDDTEITIYVNGIDVGGTAGGDAIGTVDSIANSTNLVIGAEPDGDLPMNGQIDDVRIYNYPLTPNQVRDIMNNGAVSFR